jgi:hypothetical protein
MSLGELRREVVRRERGVGALVRRRERLLGQVNALDAQIAEMGGSVGPSGLKVRTRPKNETNLVEALGKVLDAKTMSVTEVSEAVQKAGYKTTAANFRTIVNQTLINSGKFKRIERGRYTAK